MAFARKARGIQRRKDLSRDGLKSMGENAHEVNKELRGVNGRGDGRCERADGVEGWMRRGRVA